MKVYAPVKGKTIQIENIKEPVFAEKMIGDGMAVFPEDRDVCAPIDGKLISIFPTNHAFIVETDEGTKVMVHIGLDTVMLKGSPFTRVAEEGCAVSRGSVIVRSDYQTIVNAGFDPTVIVVVADKTALVKTSKNHVNVSDFLIEV